MSLIYEDSQENKIHELDLASHHENITNGIQTLRKFYKLSSNEAKKHVEKSYADRISKISNVILHYQEINNNIKSFIIYMEKTKGKSKFTFNLLKCNSPLGLGWVEIEGFSDPLTLSFNPPTFSYSQNQISELYCKIYATKEKELGKFIFDYTKKLAKIPVEQLVRCKNFSVFENYKTELVDCCFYVTIELSSNDRVQILQQKYREIRDYIEKLRVDSQGINIRNEFKASCCECAIF
ncbi:hypothetical protein SteCoe_20188 [Stentor coeruleus]|uniref:Uncharacterized protein n=1 Tax=Stentor coeruleus TaxID=5963 RepID=A0A1R2BSB0_9CILI|nr:hypothetical protein SteCoe_20188 [Stentor coeruleus]